MGTEIGEAIAVAIPVVVAAPPDNPCPTTVVFVEDGDKYGWDNKTSAAVPWKSVEKGQSDTVKAEIRPADKATKAEFTSADPGKASVSPAKATSATQVVTVNGVARGETEAKATCSGADLGKFNIATYVKKTKTFAVILVHEMNYKSTAVSDADITDMLRKVYRQAVFEFALTRLPEKTVAFDLDGDGKVDVNSWMSAEMKAIRDACKDETYDYNIFIVNNPSDNSAGFMDFNQRYGFVHPDVGEYKKTVAHELGHGAFALTHTPGDSDNIMYSSYSSAKWRLRKNQWDQINPP